MGKSVSLIDSAIETAREIEAILRDLSLLRSSEGDSIREFFVTDSPEKFKAIGERFLGEHIYHINKIKLDMEV